jgi:regulator of replication initiation timing
MQPQQPRPERRSNSRNYLLAALLILAALNVLLLYFYYQERETNKTKDATIAVKTEEVLVAKTKLDSISNQLDLKITEIQKLGGSVDSLIALRQEVEMDKKSLRNNVGTFDTSKYDAKIKRYEALLAQKDKELVQLREENGILTQENTNLSQENTGLKTERQALADSVQTYSAQNRELAEKVTIASALRAEGVTVNVLNSRGKEDDGGRYKAKKIDKLHVFFTLGPNAVARQNEKDVYMRIIDPSGAVIFDMATGSGEFTTNGQGMIYTAAQRIQFDNSGQRVDFVYGRGGQRFPEGKHVVELYSEGFKIGQGEFTVR